MATWAEDSRYNDELKGNNDEQWTRVVRKTRHGHRGQQIRRGHPPPSHITTPLTSPRSHLTEDEIRSGFTRVQSEWLRSSCCAEIRRMVRERVSGDSGRVVVVDNAVCLGLGTLDNDDCGWESTQRTYVQLCAFFVMVETISETIPIPCTFQDPAFSEPEKAFLKSLGHRVVDTPAAFDLVSASTLLFAVHLYVDVYDRSLDRALPAVFVGTPWDVWSGDMMRPDTEKPRRIEEMSRTYSVLPFPQDETATVFSNTAVHWR